MILQKKQQKSLKKNKISQAFSLIELSIVILIIGILVAGVTQSSRLVTQFRLLSARNMTQSSPVPTIKDLLIWVEATSTKSFTQEDPSDNYAIEQWNNIDPVNLDRNNAIQATESRKPNLSLKYLEWFTSGPNGWIKIHDFR
ncbi:MAG: prepilin-type N-terminal cleavage/methylation domain-containing protein [Alphaproteobacteria bacterium]